MLLTAPIIGKLRGRPRLWAYRKIKRGDFGDFLEGPSGALLVDVANVEADAGFRFSSAQLAAVGVLTPQPDEEEA
jgi:hypothetical protein